MKLRSLLVALLAVLFLVGPAFAQGGSFVSGVTLDTASVLTLAGIVLTALGAIWAVRKAVKLVNRS
jgi:hypothetical protein